MQVDRLDSIAKITCEVYDCTLEFLVENYKCRKREYVEPRQMILAKQKKFTNHADRFIGKYIFKKDHATVYHAFKTINNLSDTDERIRSISEKIDSMIISQIGQFTIQKLINYPKNMHV